MKPTKKGRKLEYPEKTLGDQLQKMPRHCLPQNTSVSALNSLCPYFQIFDQIFCGSTINQLKENSLKGQFFYDSSCKNSVWTHIFNYTDALQLDNFILFTSAKVIRRLQNTFSKNNAPCVLLSLMPMRPLLNGCCLVGVCFLGFVHSSYSSSVSCSHLSLTALNSNHLYNEQDSQPLVQCDTGQL